MMWFYTHKQLFDKIDEKAQGFFEELREDQGDDDFHYQVGNSAYVAGLFGFSLCLPVVESI
jgi:hypothetical protein